MKIPVFNLEKDQQAFYNKCIYTSSDTIKKQFSFSTKQFTSFKKIHAILPAGIQNIGLVLTREKIHLAKRKTHPISLGWDPQPPYSPGLAWFLQW